MTQSNVVLNGKRCLVLDDEFLIALDIQQILEAAGAGDVVCAGNIDDALAAVGRADFDLAVLDLKLNGTPPTSLIVAEALDKLGTPIVFLTGVQGDDVHTERFPGAPVVSKPYETALLLQAAVRALVGT